MKTELLTGAVPCSLPQQDSGREQKKLERENSLKLYSYGHKYWFRLAEAEIQRWKYTGKPFLHSSFPYSSLLPSGLLYFFLLFEATTSPSNWYKKKHGRRSVQSSFCCSFLLPLSLCSGVSSPRDAASVKNVHLHHCGPSIGYDIDNLPWQMPGKSTPLPLILVVLALPWKCLHRGVTIFSEVLSCAFYSREFPRASYEREEAPRHAKCSCSPHATKNLGRLFPVKKYSTPHWMLNKCPPQ